MWVFYVITNNNFMEAKKAILTKQIEYYLSDKNLEKDNFFYEKIQESSDVRI
jgi:hypothetical protein